MREQMQSWSLEWGKGGDNLHLVLLWGSDSIQ